MVELNKDNVTIILNYINNNIFICNNSNDNIKQIYELNDFIMKFSVDNKYQLYDVIIKNSIKLQNILDIIIEDSNINMNDEIICSFITKYFEIKYRNNNYYTDVIYEDTTDSLTLYIQEISKIPLLSEEREKKLGILASNGNIEARNILIESNLKLVVSIAKKFINIGISMQDLIQEGNIGLIIAANKYDINRKTRFSTYATWWINQKIKLKIVECSKSIRIPYHTSNRLISLKKKINELKIKLCRNPSINEISEFSNIPIEEIKDLLTADSSIVSINSIIGDDNEEELSDFILDKSVNIEEIVITDEFKKIIRNMIFETNILSDKQKYIICKRFGFNGNPMNLSDIGKNLGITSEAVRQLVVSSIIKIVRQNASTFLKYFDYNNNVVKVINEVNNDPKKFKLKK